MRIALAIGLSAFALAVPMTSALAQVPPDYEVRELERGDIEIIQSAQPFADCLVRQKTKEIPKYLGTLSANIEWVARDMSKAHPECPAPKKLGKDATFFLQTALLEALIKRDFGSTAPPANFSYLPPFRYIKGDSDLTKEWFANLIDPYDCVSRREPAKVQALLATQPQSTEEGIALGNLKATLVACQPKGEKWELRAHFARHFLAETYYTLMKVDQRKNASAH